MLWQHLFWFFGHPEVYILILPVFGMVSEVIPVFSRKVLFGYEFMAAATMAIAFISLGVWAHHMFAVGMSRTLDSTSPWPACWSRSRPGSSSSTGWPRCTAAGLSLASPMLFALGFLSMFLIGGLTGIMLATAPFDFQLTDSYFVVGHFHWVLIGGTLFGVFAGIYYWYPKVTGRMLSERLARWQFWLLFVGFILTFGPMHISGMLGMPRRIYTYEPDRGWEIWNQLATVGAFIQAPSFAIFVYNLLVSLWRGRPAGDDPWDAWTLEWATTSPPPAYNFESIPVVAQPPPALGPEAPRRPGLAVRMMRGHDVTGTNLDPVPRCWIRPVARSIPAGSTSSGRRGPRRPNAHLAHPVGHDQLPGLGGAFFSTLIVAYVTFLGEDTVGPTPARGAVAAAGRRHDACLLSSSVTIHLAERELAAGHARPVLPMVGGHDRAGRRLPAGHGL